MSDFNAASWMQDNIGRYGSRKLIDLCMTGSHDSGMSVLTGHTAGANECNTLTQSNGIGQQLQLGARYFDVRPVIASGQYKTGHYSGVPVLGAQGGNGQTMADIIQEINAFTATHEELIILKLSHDLDTDSQTRNPNYPDLNQQQWNELFSQLSGLNHLYGNTDKEVKLPELTLGDYIGAPTAAVVVVVDPSDSGITLGDYQGRGFFPMDAFPLYDSYTGTPDFGRMKDDQLDKMKKQQPARIAGTLFLLSWTLTQSDAQAVNCDNPLPFPPKEPITQLADTANAGIDEILPKCGPDCFPNIVYFDNITSDALAKLVNDINQLVP